MEQQVEIAPQLEIEKPPAKSGGIDVEPVRWVFGFLLSGLWTTYLYIRNDLSKKDKRMWSLSLLVSAVLALWVNPNGFATSGLKEFLITTGIAFTILHGALFVGREIQLQVRLSKMRASVSKAREYHQHLKDWHAETDIDALVNYKPELKEKLWTNDEAFDAMEKIYGMWLENSKVFTKNNAFNLYALKDYIMEQKRSVEKVESYRYSFENWKSVKVNEDVQKWSKLVSPYLNTLNDAFFKETISYIELIQRQRDGIHRGVTGERMVINYLKDYESEMLPLYGNRFQSENGTVENDVLLFTERGIFALEIKNIMSAGNQRLKIARDGQTYEWKRDKKDDQENWVRSDHHKIFDQVNRHTVLTEKKLAEGFSNKQDLEIRSLIVIPNNNVEIINESLFDIIRPSQIATYIRKEPYRISKEQAIAMRDYMQSLDMGAGVFKFPDVEEYSLLLLKRLNLIHKVPFIRGLGDNIYALYHNNVAGKPLTRINYLKKMNMKRGKFVM